MKYYVIDSFTDTLFKGNPAGVCILDHEISNDLMQSIAFENNLAETAFLIEENNHYYIKWFTPEKEMDLCGHATLATAFVVMNYLEKEKKIVEFESKSGRLIVRKENNLYTMDFPQRKPTKVENIKGLDKALGCDILETYKSRDILVVVKNEQIVKNLNPNFEDLRKIDNDINFTIIVTAKGDTTDFVSRFFIPNETINEDPVTGSSHCSLIPFWSERFCKKEMIATQLSKRGGILYCENKENRVLISGNAKCYLAGELEV